MKKIYSIYKVTNQVNNHVYIGFTQNFKVRKHAHMKASEKGIDIPFYRAIRKYGWNNFSWEIIYQSKDGEHTKNIMEPYFISLYYSNDGIHGYNSTCGGDGLTSKSWIQEMRKRQSELTKIGMSRPEIKQKISDGLKKYYQENPNSVLMKGKKHSEESKNKMSQAHLQMTEETKNKIGQASHNMWNNPESRKKILEHIQNPSKETRAKMSAAKKGKPSWNKGKKWSPKTIEKMRRVKLGKKIPEETRKKMSLSGGKKLAKTYTFIDPDGNKIQIHNLSEFSRQHKLNQGLMSAVNLGKRSHHKGYTQYITV